MSEGMSPTRTGTHHASGVGKAFREGAFFLLMVLTLLSLSACAVGPDFKPPEVSVPGSFSGQAPVSSGPVSSEADLRHWWTVFADPTLTSLIQRALSSNLDLKRADARIRQARAARGVALSGLGPTVEAQGAFQRSQASGTSLGTKGDKVSGPLANTYQVGFDASWELDVFGGIRRGVEAADADLRAALDARRDALVRLTAEVGRTYIDLRAYQQRIAVARRNLDAQAHSAKLTRQRFQAGFVNGLDVAEAQAQVATTAAQIPLLESAERQSMYSLAILLGQNPAFLLGELSPSGEIPLAGPPVPIGLPSELLRRRPDIRRAEAEIHAATARVGVATADLFPRFYLFGSSGYQSTDSRSLFDPLSAFWSIGPSAAWTLFSTGRIRAQIEVQEAIEEEALVTYELTVLQALQEVENALVACEKEEGHRRALVDAVIANRKAVALSTSLYVEGQTDFLNVIQSQRALYVSEEALVKSVQTVSTNLVALYKSLGGGWDSEEAGPP